MKVDPSELRYGLVVQGRISATWGGPVLPGRIIMLVAKEHDRLGYPLWKGIALWDPTGTMDVDDDGYAHCTFGPAHSWSHPE